MPKPQLVAFMILGAAILILFPATSIGQQPDLQKNQGKKSETVEEKNDGKPGQGVVNPPLGINFMSLFKLRPRIASYCFAGTLSEGLPSWFNDFDKDEDGQVSLSEWREGGKKIGEFRTYDLNDDGFITAEEVRRYLQRPLELKLENGQADCNSTIEAADERYRGKKSFRIFNIQLERGKTYQFDHMTKSFDAYLYLEDPEGELLAEDDDGGGGLNSRIVYRAEMTGVYRLIATSLGSSRPAPFSFSARVISRFGVVPKGLPKWFKDLDQDEDGQVALHEWRVGGKKLGEFRAHDQNDDGFITAEEILRYLKKPFELKLESGQAKHQGAIEETTEEKYRGKKAFKIFTIKLEAGKTYQVDYLSQAYYAYLYLEDAEGNLLDKHNSGGRGLNSRIVHSAAKAGTYRVIATSQDGHRTGDFSLSVRATGY